jgi:hypothetical protein
MMKAHSVRTLVVCLVVASSLATVRSAVADTLTLTWDPNTAVAGYKVYAGTQSGTYTQQFNVGSATTFTYQNAVAGQRYCFAVSAYSSTSLEGPKSSEVCGFSNAPPTLENPGNQSSPIGHPVSLQLQGSDPEGRPLTYSASGLPPGVTLMASTGFISGSGQTAGNYSTRVTASDGVLSSSQSFIWAMATAPVSDLTRPTVTIIGPTSASSYTAPKSTVVVSGTAADNVAVTQVTWVNDRGGNGVSTGTTTWTTPSIGLQTGTNVITVEARDAAGNQALDTLTVTYSSSTALAISVSLSAQAINRSSNDQVNLSWTTAPWRQVVVYRNGTSIGDTANDGSFTDRMRNAGGNYSYKVCNPDSTTCSNTVTVTF